ncbi:MAG: hypothetical protein ACYC35_21560 [Pirellulales bacterium]
MSTSEEREAGRRRMILLAPLMIASNAIVLLSIAGLLVLTLNGGENLGILPGGGDANHRIVEEYLAQRVPADAYRIREWFPAAPLEATDTAVASNVPKSATEKGVAQRVTLVHYGPNGARQVDTVFWIQDGTVTRVVEANRGRFAQCL